jgi:Flp pilus assembly protein TadG
MRQLVIRFERLAQRLLINEDGVVAIEFGVVASMIILMLIGATDLGLAARHRSQMEGAVRAGIQEALLGGTEDAVESAVEQSTDLPSSPEPTVSAAKVCYDASDVKLDSCSDPLVAKGYMEVTLQQEHKWLLGFPGFSNPITLKITNSVRVL